MKSRSLKFLEPSGPVQPCNETALPFIFSMMYFNIWCFSFAGRSLTRVQTFGKTQLSQSSLLSLIWSQLYSSKMFLTKSQTKKCRNPENTTNFTTMKISNLSTT